MNYNGISKSSYLIILMCEPGHTHPHRVSDQAKTQARGVGFRTRHKRGQSDHDKKRKRAKSLSISPREDFASSELSSLLKKWSSLFKNYQVYLKQIPTSLFTSVNNTFIGIFTLIIKWAKIHQNIFPRKNIQVYLNSYTLEMFKCIWKEAIKTLFLRFLRTRRQVGINRD